MVGFWPADAQIFKILHRKVEVVLSTEYLIWSGRMLHSSATHAMLLQAAPILLLDLEIMIKSATFLRMIPSVMKALYLRV